MHAAARDRIAAAALIGGPMPFSPHPEQPLELATGRRLSRRTAVMTGAGLAAAAVVPAVAQESTPTPATAPMLGFDIYVAGLHCAKEHPSVQMEAHHYCKSVGDGFLQCALFDGSTQDAKLIGLEYIIAEARFQGLDEDEQPYWHPHNYEVFGGQLVAPTLDEAAELELMRMLLNSYGKTWHAWHPSGPGEPGDELPLGPALLQWSFNRDGEADESLLRSYVERLGIDMEAKRRARQPLVPEAHPQEGVDVIADAFPNSTAEPPPGVQDVVEARETGTPTP
jgi:hypothetical protein